VPSGDWCCRVLCVAELMSGISALCWSLIGETTSGLHYEYFSLALRSLSLVVFVCLSCRSVYQCLFVIGAVVRLTVINIIFVVVSLLLFPFLMKITNRLLLRLYFGTVDFHSGNDDLIQTQTYDTICSMLCVSTSVQLQTYIG